MEAFVLRVIRVEDLTGLYAERRDADRRVGDRKWVTHRFFEVVIQILSLKEGYQGISVGAAQGRKSLRNSAW